MKRLLQTRGSASASQMISLVCLCSALLTWSTADCWSYHFSENTMNWQDARAWCQDHHTDMVAIQNQEEIAHLNDWLPKKPTYYWIGIRKIDDVWTWVGTNKALTEEATNWARGEPNNGNRNLGQSEDCVEMYVKREDQAGKWNDERCGKYKTALCYSAACKNDSCLYGECVETINSHRCQCDEGFYGEKCEHVIYCNKDEVTVPDNGGFSCSHKYGEFSFDTVCRYSCEEGYQLSMPRPVKCTAAKTWSDHPPSCEVVRCPELSRPEWGSMSCSDLLGPSSYQSTCVFACKEGYVLTGSQTDTLFCGPKGNWNTSQPSCTAVQCPVLLEEENLIMTCEGDENTRFSFGHSCSFTCAPGFNLVGANAITCTSSADWSNSTPQCEAVQCPALQNPENGLINCGDNPDTKFCYGNTCSFSCLPGYNLVGADKVTCTTAAVWSESQPRCEAVQCPALTDLENVVASCDGEEFSYGNLCLFSCQPGYRLVGTKEVKCTSSAEWSGSLPHCEAITCPALEENAHLNMVCGSSPSEQGPGSACSFSCEPGFLLLGARTLECSEDGQWNEAMPMCEDVICPFLEAPEHGHMLCSSETTLYSSQCSFSCAQGYTLEGHDVLICDLHGNWTGDTPTCKPEPSQMTLAVSGVTIGGAVSLSGLSMAMWILRRLRKKASTFELSSSSDIEVPPQSYKNSIDSLI